MYTSLSIIATSIRSGIKDVRVAIPFRLFISTTLPRLLTQILFFALLGQFLGGKSFLLYAVVGNAVASMAGPAIAAITQDFSRALRSGTLALLVATPTNALLPISAWGTGQLLMGVIQSFIGLFLLAPLLGIHLEPSALLVIPLLLLSALSLYGLGLVLAAISLRIRASVLASNGLIFLIYTLAGVNYPIVALPVLVQYIGYSLPLSHALLAIRALITGNDMSHVPLYLLQECGIGLCYWLAGLALFHWQIRSGRRQGTLDFQF